MLSAFAEATITVNPAPPVQVQAPTVTAGGNQTITLPAGATLAGAVTDDGLPVGATVTSQWTQQSGPGTTTFASASSAATTATFSAPGTYVLRLTASDTALTAFAEATITVNPAPPVNQAPTVTAGGNQTITLPAGATLAGTVTDDGLPVGATVTSQWTQLSGPGTTTFANAASPATTATFSAAGTYVLRLTATDTALAASSQVTITVDPPVVVNQPPVVTAGANQTITLPAGATLNGSVQDDGYPQGGTLTSLWSQVGGPGTAVFASPSSGSTTVTFDTDGVYILRLTASDGALSAFADTTVTVNPIVVVNQAPTVTAGADQTITLPNAATLTGSVSDDGLPSGATVTSQWSAQSGPGTVTFASSTSAQTTATFSVAGTYVLRLTASDTLLSAFAETTVTVNPAPPVNQAPQVTAGANQTITLPSGATLAGTVTDDGLPAGATVTSQWSQQSGPGTATFANGASPATTVTFSTAGTYVLRLTASDTALNAFADTTVLVNPAPPVNQVPVVTTGANQTITLPNAASLTGTVTDDGLPAGASVTTQWTQQSGPGTTTFANAASPSTTATFSAAGLYVLRLTANDSLLSAFAEVTITVNAGAINAAPTVTAGPNQTITLPNLATLFGSVADDGLPVNAAVTAQWSKISGPGTTIVASPTSPSTSASFSAPGTYVLRLTATDGVLSAFSDTTITVNPAVVVNQPPTVTAGPNQVITLPAAANLSGTVTDDGQPQGATVTSLWTQQSGAGTTTFGDATKAVTTASFSAPGSYVLRLTATDSVKSAYAELTITVKPAPPVNQPPVVTTGAAITITLPASASLTGSVTDDGQPQGAALTSTWSQQSGPGTTTLADASAPVTTATFSTAGDYVLALTATDTDLSASATITVHAVAPVITNRAPTVDAGPDVQIAWGGTAHLQGNVTDDGQPLPASLVASWQKQSGPGAVTFVSASSPATDATFTVPGIYVLTLSATDSALTATDDVVITVDPPAGPSDRSPPVLTLNVPTSALPGASVTAVVTASDNTAVTSVSIDVDGDTPVVLSTPPFQRTFTVPSLVSPGTTILVHATASDAAQNTAASNATVAIGVVPDTTNPTVQVFGPQSTAPGASIYLTATAADASGIDTVAFSVDGVPVGSATTAPYSATFTVPAGATPGTPLVATAQATDFAGNAASSTVQIAVQAQGQAAPPTITLNAPIDAAPGDVITLDAQATDVAGVASVEFRQGNAVLKSLVTSPHTTTVTVPLLAPAGSTLDFTAVATNYANLTATDSKSVRVRALTSTSIGVLTGEVYDDSTSLPVAGAFVELIGTDAQGAPYTGTTTTDGRGRYTLRANAGTAVVRISKAQWTSADRPATLVGGQAIELLDARLTPLALVQTVTAAAGGTLTLAAGSLTLPAGALPQGGPISFAVVSQQGLQGRAPLGWSPVGVVDVWPHDVALASPAIVHVRSLAAIAPAQSVTVALFDRAAGGWRVLGSATLAANGKDLDGVSPTTGQIAFFVPDVAPVAPPAPVAGALLQGVNAPVLPTGRVTTMQPQPPVAFYQPGVTAAVHSEVTVSAPVTSGARFTSRVSEQYTFNNGGVATPQPFVEDVLFFQSAAAPDTLTSDLTVSPSLVFESATLSNGLITVELFDGQPTTTVPVLDALGGQVQGPNGELLVLPPAALQSVTPVTLRSIDAAGFGQPLPAGLSFVGGLDVTLQATLARAGAIAIPKPSSLVTDVGVVLVRLEPIQGQTRLRLVGVGRISGNTLVSDTIIGGQQTVLEGVRGDGQYVFLDSTTPLGFAGGTVLATTGQPFAGALITASTFPVVSVSTGAGAYVAAAPAGTTQFTAADLLKNDTGAAPAYLVAATVVPLPLQLTAQPPRITLVTPTDGTKNVPLAGTVVVTFSEPVDPASITLASMSVTGPAGAVNGVRALTQNNTVLTFRPVTPLSPNVRYTVDLTTAVTDVTGYGLAAPFSSTFDSLDTNPPAPPAAGAITASVPDAQGLTTVAATQGTANPTDRVFVDNLTSGAVGVALVQGDGSFTTSLTAFASDKLRVRIIDLAGNETAIDLGAFQQTNPDGSVSQFVPAEGAVVKGPNGIEAEVPAGAFDQGAVVTIKDVPLANFPVSMTPQEAANWPLTQAVQLDFGGAEPKVPIRLSVNAQPGDTANDQWLVLQAVDLSGQKYLNVVDTAQYANGRITDPPVYCPGVMAAAVYGIAKAAQTYGLNYALMQSDGRYQLQAQTQTFQLGLPFAVPFTAFNTLLPTPVCFPVMTGRVTVSPNSVLFSVSSTALYLADEQVQIRNVTKGTSKVVTRTIDPTPFEFEITGSIFDNFRIVEKGSSTPVPVPYTVADGSTLLTVKITPKFDRVPYPVQDFTVTNLTRNISLDFSVPVFNFAVSMIGDIQDTYEITGIPSAISKAAPHVITSNYSVASTGRGNGNLVVRAEVATIDPTRAEANAAGQTGGAARTSCPAGQTVPVAGSPCGVVLSSASGAVNMIIPDTSIVNGGFDVAFSGSESDVYSLTVNYDTRPPFTIELPRFTITILSKLTGAIIKTITGQSPPKNEPLSLTDLVGKITDDFTAPFLLSGPQVVSDLGSGSFISFTFSEAMDADSLTANLILADASGNQIDGEVRVSNGNRTVTFVPSVTDAVTGLQQGGLQLGQTYILTIKGALQATGAALAGACQTVCDAAGNAFQGVVSMPITTFGPRLLQRYPSTVPLKDVAMIRRKAPDAQGNLVDQTSLFVTAGQLDVYTLDVTDLSKPPTRIGIEHASRPGLQRLSLLPDINQSIGGTQVRDLLVATAFGLDAQGGNASFLNFFDASVPGQVTALGSEVLTSDPDPQFGVQLPGSVLGTGFAKGVAGVVDGNGKPFAFAAVERVGVFGVDVAKRMSGGVGSGHLKAGGQASFGGDYTDIVPYGCTDPAQPASCDKLVALKRTRDGQDIVVLNQGMTQLGAAALPANARRLRVVEHVGIDISGDGKISASEQLDLAFVGGDNGISIVLLGRQNSQIGSSAETLPKLYGRVPISGTVLDLDILVDSLQVVAAFDSTYPGTSGTFLSLIDVSRPNTTTLVDKNTDGIDDRMVYRNPMPSGVNGMRIDQGRELLYVASPSGLDIYKVGNLCCDLRVDMKQKRSPQQLTGGSTADLLAREKKALKTGIVKGLARASQMCQGFDPSLMRIWESGSSACLWTATPDKACGSNYQPGVSDHDLSTFMPDAWYLQLVNNPDKTSDPKDKRPAQVPLASCVVQALTYPFTNPNINDPELSPREKDDPEGVGFRFADISFLPNYTADLTSMRYRLARTMPGIPGDSDNTLGLGMQGLILKHLTEANGVELSGVQDPAIGYQPAFDQVGVSEQQIQQYLLKYRTDPSVKIPTIEGFEWANLMEYQLRKAYTGVRIKGAYDTNSQFNDLFVSQLHLAGKAGIRAALGRLSAVPATRDLILNFRRDATDNNPGPIVGQPPLTLRGAGANACFLYDKTEPDPTKWSTTECTGMEHYVASVAIRALALQSTLLPSEQMFTLADVRQTFDFYLVKSDDRDRKINTDEEADDFIGATFQFVLQTKTLTQPEYLKWINPATSTSTHPIDATPDPDQLNSGAQDPEGITTTRGQRRVNNMARKGVRMGAKAITHLHVVPHIQNRGQRTARDIKVGMYVKVPGGAQQQYTWTQVDTGATLGFETLKKVDGGSDTYLEFQTDSDGSLSRDPGSDPQDEGVGKTLDLFELEVDQENGPKGVPGYVAFTVDLPDRSVKEANRRNNYDGFFYYVIDPAQCVPNTGTNAYGYTCTQPTGMGGKVPFPLPNSTLLLPDGECDLLPDVTITQSIQTSTGSNTGTTLIETGESAQVLVTVTNNGDAQVDNVKVWSAVGTSSIGSIAALSSHTFILGTIKSDTRAVVTSLPSVTADNLGFQLGPPATVLVNACGTGPYVVGYTNDPNPTGDLSRVMQNGTAVRYFRAVNADGSPAANTTIVVRVPGLTGTFSFTTDASGDFLYDATRFNPKGQQVTEKAKGIGIPFNSYVRSLASANLPASVNLVSINGQPVQCADPTLFKVFVDPLKFTYDFEAGGAIEAGLDVFGVAGAKVGLGGSFRLRLFHRGPDPTLTETGIYRLDWERKTKFDFGAQFGFKGFSAESEFSRQGDVSKKYYVGKSAAEAFKLGGNVNAVATQAYRYTFPGPPSAWQPQDKAAFTGILFPSVSEADETALIRILSAPISGPYADPNDPDNRAYRKAAGTILDQVLGSVDQYKPYRSARIGSFSAAGDITATPFKATVDFAIQTNDPNNKPVAKDEDGTTGRTANAGTDSSDEKTEKSEPLFKADSSFTGKFNVTYDVEEQLKHEIGDPIRLKPNAPGEQVVGMIHTLTFDTQYDYKAEFKTNLAAVKAEIDTPSVNYPNEPQFVKDQAKAGLDWLEKRIAGSDAAQFDGGLQFRVFSKLGFPGASSLPGPVAPSFQPWRLEVTFRGPKNFGIVGGHDAGPGDRYSLTFAVQGEKETNAVIAEAFQQAEAFRLLLTQTQEAEMRAFVNQLKGGTLPAEVDHVSPANLYLWFLKFVKSVLIYGGRPSGGAVNGKFGETTTSYPEFYEEITKGKRETSSFGLENSKFDGSKIGVKIRPFELDSGVNYRTSRGIVARGQLVVLEDYGAVQMTVQTPEQLIKTAIQTNIANAVSAIQNKLFGFTIFNWGSPGTGGTQTTTKSAVQLNSDTDQQHSTLGLWDFRKAPGLPPVTPYQPGDDNVPDHKPHYGLGGFRIITADRPQMAFDAPAQLTLSWDDAEIDGFPESAVRLFVWDPPKDDWTMLPAAIDTTANTATATITRAGVYTLGAVMPAGKITWVITGLNRSGSGTTATTSVSIESAAAILNNDGTPVTPGELMHAIVFDGGTIVTPDIDPALAETQFPVSPDGKVRLTLTFPGSPTEARVQVFSHLGTVDGTADIVLP
ncbi:MAG: Ig-like domain-containing protein [Vicinamibacterales bacterium]